MLLHGLPIVFKVPCRETLVCLMPEAATLLPCAAEGFAAKLPFVLVISQEPRIIFGGASTSDVDG